MAKKVVKKRVGNIFTSSVMERLKEMEK